MTFTETLANIILHVVLIATFVTIFFFTWGAKLEKQVMESQMDYICRDFASNIRILSPNAADAIKLQLSKLPIPNLEEEDKAAAAANKKLMQHTTIIVVTAFILGLVAVIGLGFAFKLPAKQIILANLVSLVAVALTYFVFSTYFVTAYKSADPNFVKLQVIKALFTGPTPAPAPAGPSPAPTPSH